MRLSPSFLWLLPLLTLLVCLWWGPFFPDAVYEKLTQINLLTTGQLPVAQVWTTPLYSGLLALAAFVSLDLATAALVLGGLVWGITAVSVALIFQHQPALSAEGGDGLAATTAVFAIPLLLTLPIVPLNLGQEALLLIGGAWLLAALHLMPYQAAKTGVAVLLPALQPTPATILLSLYFLKPNRATKIGRSWWGVLLLGGWLAVWGYVVRGLVSSWWQPSLASWFESMNAQWQNQAVWLLLPLALWTVFCCLKTRNELQQALIVLLLWSLTLPLFSVTGGMVATAVSLVVFAAFGVATLLQAIWKMSFAPARYVSLLLLLPLLLLQVFALWRVYTLRPTARFALEEAVGAWLAEEGEGEVSLLAPAYVGYVVGQKNGRFFPQIEPPNLATSLQTTPVDYLVTANELPAYHLAQAAWFQEAYEALETVASPYESSSPYTIWGHRSTIYQLGPGQPLNVVVNQELALVGYQLGAPILQPEQPLSLNLFMQAKQPNLPPFEAIVRLESPQGTIEQRFPLPMTKTADLDQRDQLLVETLRVALPSDVAVGAYQLTLAFQPANAASVWPLYRNNDQNALDRVRLQQVVIPWPGDLATKTPTDAVFDNQIRLAGYELLENVGDDPNRIDVDLYWQATSPPLADYIVFVHLLDPQGQLVTSHDSQPANGRFPTSAFISEDVVVPDGHPLTLPADLPAGSYQINVGLYLPETGERLIVRNGAGEEIPDRAWRLTAVSRPEAPSR